MYSITQTFRLTKRLSLPKELILRVYNDNIAYILDMYLSIDHVTYISAIVCMPPFVQRQLLRSTMAAPIIARVWNGICAALNRARRVTLP